ncbi:MAG: MlaD family protein [Acidobacteriota bacterium]|jgi:phospholipid/cholesterol/gamma-HCH transport system substrate-binding protein
MATRQKISIAEMKVGIFVTVALLVLAGAILQQSWGVNWFGHQVKAITYLPDVGGLKPGAPVWLAGIEIGKVTKVTIVPPETYSGNKPIFLQIDELHKQLAALDPTAPNAGKIASDLQDSLRDLSLELRFVEVQMQIGQQYLDRISSDSAVSIESKGLIGDSLIEISLGTYHIPPQKVADAYVIEGIRTTGIREIMTGANDVIANFGVLSDQVKNIALKINPEKVGTNLQTAVQDMQTTMKAAQDTFTHATTLMDAMRSGNGTISRLISDPAAYEHLTDSLDKFNKIANNIENGSGTLTKLIQNPQLFDNANDALRKADVMMDRIEKGEGTLGMLSKDTMLYQRTSQAVEKFSNFVDQIENGQGTLGKLYKDPSLYENLNQSTAEITKLIYDLRQDPKKYLTIHFRLF